MAASFSLSASSASIVPGGSLANAASVGAKTVTGPAPCRVSAIAAGAALGVEGVQRLGEPRSLYGLHERCEVARFDRDIHDGLVALLLHTWLRRCHGRKGEQRRDGGD